MVLEKTTKQLIRIAKYRMRSSADPIHDLGHAKRVVHYAKMIGSSLNLATNEKQVVELAAWWHDVGRTVTKRPSFLWMLLLDDIISALFLAWTAVRIKKFNKTARRTVRILLSHSFGTGRILNRFLLAKRDRELLTIIIDADKLDILCVQRLEKVLSLSSYSQTYGWGYRLISWYNFTSHYLRMRTDLGRMFFCEVLDEFSDWINQPNIADWHIEHFGEVWAEETFVKINHLMQEAQLAAHDTKM